MDKPLCPEPTHAGGRVVRAGWAGRPPHRRQRWWCHPPPKVKAESHRFTELLPRREAEDDACATCSTELEPWEGQNGPRDYWFAAREIAHCLFLIAQGSSYRDAGYEARRLGQRLSYTRGPKYMGRSRRKPDRDGQMAANWVDVFTEVVSDGLLPLSWPERLAVDSTGFASGRLAANRAGMRFNLLVCVGYEGASEAGQVWRIMASPTKTNWAWRRCFSSLTGTPASIVSDQDKSITGAVRALWSGPDAPEHRLCELHLLRRLETRIPSSITANKQHPMMTLRPYALSSQGGFQRFEDAVKDEFYVQNNRRVGGLLAWLRGLRPLIWPQLVSRQSYGPNSTGAAEGAIQKLQEHLDKRARTMTNLARAQKLMDLLQLGMNGQADEQEWAERIRNHLLAHRGRAPFQRPHDDPFGTWSLLS